MRGERADAFRFEERSHALGVGGFGGGGRRGRGGVLRHGAGVGDVATARQCAYS